MSLTNVWNRLMRRPAASRRQQAHRTPTFPGRWFRPRIAVVALGLLMGLTVPAKADDDYDFTTIDVPGATSTEALGINASGQIVGQYDDASGTTHGYLLCKGKYTTLDVPGATS